MILNAQTISRLCEDCGMIEPFVGQKTVINGMSYGLSAASYDVRIGHDLVMGPGESALAHTEENFDIPDNICAMVFDKSTYARRFVSAMNTFIDPGFRGNLTLELINHSDEIVRIKKGDPICQIVFQAMNGATDRPYQGKYSGQSKAAHGPRYEEADGAYSIKSW